MSNMAFGEYHKSLIYDKEKFKAFVTTNLDYVREHDLREVYESVWRNKFRAAIGSRSVYVENNGTVGCIRVRVQSSNGGDCYSPCPWRVDFNQPVESEAAKLVTYIVSLYGSIESLEVHQRFSDSVGHLELNQEGTKLTGKRYSAHVDCLIDFVDWLSSGILSENLGPAQTAMKELGLAYNSGKFKVEYKDITIETWLNGKIVLSGLTAEHCERWEVLRAAVSVKTP